MRLLAVLLLAAASAPKVTVDVSPHVIDPRGQVRVTCRVPRDARNVSLRMGVENLTTSERELDGENAKITHEQHVSHVDCASGPAWCELTFREHGETRVRRVTTELVVAGCDANEYTPDLQ